MERKLALYDLDNNLVWSQIDVKVKDGIAYVYDPKEMGWYKVEYAIPDGEKWFLTRLVTANCTYIVHSAELMRLGPIKGWPMLGGGGGQVAIITGNEGRDVFVPLCVGPHGGVLIGGKEQSEIAYILRSPSGNDDSMAEIHTAGPVYFAWQGDVIAAGLAGWLVDA